MSRSSKIADRTARPAICAQIESFARIAGSLFEAPVAVIWLQDPVSPTVGGESLFGNASHGIDGADSLFSATMADADGVFVYDTQGDARFAACPGLLFFAGVPVINDAGIAIGVLCVADIAPRGAVSPARADDLRAMAKAASTAIELAEISHCEDVLISLGSRSSGLGGLHPNSDGFEAIVDALPQLVWSATPNGQGDYFGRQWCEYTGAPASAGSGAGWLSFVHPDDAAAVSASWNVAVWSGDSYSAEFRLRNAEGAYRWMLTRGLPATDERGAIARWVCTCTDIEERVRSGDMLEFMSRELSHRIKNMFAVVQSLISMALRKHEGMSQVSQSLQMRMVALGRAHDLVRPRFAEGANLRSQTTLCDLIRTLTQAYVEDDPSRLEISGGDTVLGEQAATPLALFFHEMAINSAMFGALSVPDGQLQIALAVGDDVVVDWRESGGPAITEPPVPAFGLGLTRLTVERQLGGKLDMDWRADGLRAVATIPLRQLRGQ